MITLNERLTNEATNSVNTKQNETINLFRLLVSFLVISVHVHANTSLSTQWNAIAILFCVPYFFSTALFFFTKNLSKNHPVISVLKNSWLRVGVPFITWSSVYLALLLIKHTMTGSNQPLTFFSIVRAYLYGESAEHLYYLPELIAMQVIILGIDTIRKNKTAMLGWFLLLLAASYLGWGYSHNYYGVTPLVALFIYLTCAFLLANDSAFTQHRRLYFLTGILLILIITANPYLYLSASYNLPLGGIGLLLIALSTRSFTIPNWMRLVSSATYGIYLSHVLFLEAFEFTIERMHVQLFYTLPVKLSVALFIFLVSLVFTLIIQHIPFLRVVFLGEKQ